VSTIAYLSAGLSALLSVMFFVLESVLFTKPAGRATFQTTSEQAEATRIWAFNQGFYNLFLAIGISIGIGLMATGGAEAGRPLVLFGCGSMLGAAVVLVVSGGKAFLRGALIQGVPPLVAVVTVLVNSRPGH
jgi:putative membrane protein